MTIRVPSTGSVMGTAGFIAIRFSARRERKSSTSSARRSNLDGGLVGKSTNSRVWSSFNDQLGSAIVLLLLCGPTVPDDFGWPLQPARVYQIKLVRSGSKVSDETNSRNVARRDSVAA